MTSGMALALVHAHLQSFTNGNVEDFDQQLDANFRYAFLPPVMGLGPVHARRWRQMMFSIYREWDYEIIDQHENGDQAILRMEWRASGPVDPDNTPSEFRDTAIAVYRIANCKLIECSASYLDYSDRMAS